MNPKTERKCRKCGKHKESVSNYRIMPSGQRSQICNSCFETKTEEEEVKCKSCYKTKKKKRFTKQDNICDHCTLNVKTKPKSVKKNKKDDGVVDRNINSFENVSNERAKALKALEKAKELEQIKKSKGLTYVKSGLRSFILK